MQVWILLFISLVNENFVCLICVHFLLKKGYEAKHIVFEPAFKVGHVNKPSYGDILVFDKEYNPLVLIENKTFGTEFSKEWNLMQKDGGQLFSYLGPLVNEMGLCENLALFAADFDDIDIIPKSHIITLRDNEKRIAELENPKTFADAKGKYFEVWNETYAKSFETKGLFEDDIAPYTIGKLKYTISDLKGLSHAEIKPIYHEFATILRNNAITDFEHSFYILIDLFLCKITDELNNPDDLQFYYKGVTRDTPKEYCSRLLKLYQQGKKQLFDVEVVNKEEEDIKQIFEDTNRSITNGLFAGIKELFEEIKFYNIKKFNFIDVENKEEFDMNFQILIKIAALIQDINLSSSETNHFFGDLFEGLLSKNVHQTEGQFFTPLPIVNFIIKSMPEFPNSDNVKVLDYACGAGHFLTEFVKHYPKAKIYGIEKSQTLSQVAKIATIINGSKDSRIIFKDALSYINTTECIAVDAEIKKANEKIGDLEEKINALVKNINGVKYKLGKIAQFKNGLNYDKSSAGEEVSIVGVADFKDNKSPIWDDVEKVVINGKLEDAFLLQKNDLLTVRSNGSQELVGRFMIVNKDLKEKTTFSGFTIRVRPDNEVVKSEFLYYILSSPIIRKQLVVGSNGSNIKSLNQTLLANVEISIPSMKKQEEILSELLDIEKQIIEQRSIIEFGQDKKNRIIEDELV